MVDATEEQNTAYFLTSAFMFAILCLVMLVMLGLYTAYGGLVRKGGAALSPDMLQTYRSNQRLSRSRRLLQRP